MDYLKSSALFKIKKVARYVRLYGVSRTYIKVLGQRHMRRHYTKLPAIGKEIRSDQIVGIIGCGNFAFCNTAYYLQRRFGRVIAACMDSDLHRAASLSAQYDVPIYTDDAREIFENKNIRMVYIASNHASHADYAIEALKAGKHVYIEKPHVVSEDQLIRLSGAANSSPGKIFLGFNRPHSPFGEIIARHLKGEEGPAIYNWFVAGHAIPPDHWYHKPGEGGRVLGNLWHWTDHILRLEPGSSAYPILINPTRAEKSDCDIAVTFTFGNGTIAAITFSAKGDAFEGVKERFSAHKGRCLITMDDFQTMTIETGPRKKMYSRRHRDQGHARSITAAFENVRDSLPYDRQSSLNHAWNTAWLILKTQQALERNEKISVSDFASAQGGQGR